MVFPCGHCGKAASSHCSRCLRAHYCSCECQRADWHEHKRSCDKLKLADPKDPFVEWGRDPARGRFVQARRFIPANKVIFTEMPSAATSTFFRAGKRFKAFFPQGCYAGAAVDPEEVGGMSGENARLTAGLIKNGWDEKTVATYFSLSSPDGEATVYDRAILANNFRMICPYMQIEYGCALVFMASSINHSCIANARYVFGAEGRMYAVAITDITPGDEVTFPYCMPAACNKFCTCVRNKEFLRPILGGDCICAKCVAEPCEQPCRIQPYNDTERDLVQRVLEAVPDIETRLSCAEPPAQSLCAMAVAWESGAIKGIADNDFQLGIFATRFAGNICLLGGDYSGLGQNTEMLLRTALGLSLAMNIKRDDAVAMNDELCPNLFRAIAGIVRDSGNANIDDERLVGSCKAWVSERIQMSPWMRPNFRDFAPCVSMLGRKIGAIFDKLADLNRDHTVFDRTRRE